MPDGQEGQLDFSDLGGQRVAEAGGQVHSGSFFSDFGDMGAHALQNPPDWLKEWPAPNTRLLDFSDIGGQRVTGPGGHVPITPTQPQHQAAPTMPNANAESSAELRGLPQHQNAIACRLSH